MAHTNINEKDGNEKDGQKTYDTFSNDRMYDCHMVDAHLRAIHSLIGKIQNEAHEHIPMSIKGDLSCAGYLLQSARERLDSVITALDESCYQYEKKSAPVVEA